MRRSEERIDCFRTVSVLRLTNALYLLVCLLEIVHRHDDEIVVLTKMNELDSKMKRWTFLHVWRTFIIFVILRSIYARTMNVYYGDRICGRGQPRSLISARCSDSLMYFLVACFYILFWYNGVWWMLYEESQKGRNWKEGISSLHDASQPCPKSKSKSWFCHHNSPKKDTIIGSD